VECDAETPLCLYDFTLKTIMIDYQAFSIKDFSQILVDQTYFYGDDYPKPSMEVFIPISKPNSRPKQIEESKDEKQQPQEVSAQNNLKPKSWPDVPIHHGYHICSKALETTFKDQFCKNYDLTESEDIGKLFENPVMPVSNITSQPVSLLRLMQFRRFLTDDK
jgi:hypothetical protein